jgi:hypothetical protein
MAKSLLEELPAIVAAGKRQAAQILESLEGRSKVTLQTRELVIPAKDTNTVDLFRAARQPEDPSGEPNRLVYGDHLLTLAALLAGDEQFESLRGKVDLIYIDPPFDSKADYRTKITLPGTTIDQKPTVLEQFAYSDTWADGTASYLAMVTSRLVLMRELLSGTCWPVSKIPTSRTRMTRANSPRPATTSTPRQRSRASSQSRRAQPRATRSTCSIAGTCVAVRCRHSRTCPTWWYSTTRRITSTNCARPKRSQMWSGSGA